jgi:hypothetical protein
MHMVGARKGPSGRVTPLLLLQRDHLFIADRSKNFISSRAGMREPLVFINEAEYIPISSDDRLKFSSI